MRRDDFRAVITFRESIPNSRRAEPSKFAGTITTPSTSPGGDRPPCFLHQPSPSRKGGRFLLSIRRRIDHTVSFKTIPEI